MLCDDVKRVVYFFLDGTLGDRSRRDFDSHLQLCPSCEARMRFHQKMRGFIRSRLNRVTAPTHLRTRLERSIRAFRTEWSQQS